MLLVVTEVRTMPGTHIVFHVDIFNEQQKKVNGGRVRLCFFNAQTRQVVQAPEHLLERLRPCFSGETP
jgi:acyl-CoA thioesterase FadM